MPFRSKPRVGLAVLLTALFAVIGACSSDSGSRGDDEVTTRTSDVVDVRRAVEARLQAEGVTGWAVSDDGQTVSLHLPVGSERVGADIVDDFGPRVRITYGPPARPATSRP